MGFAIAAISVIVLTSFYKFNKKSKRITWILTRSLGLMILTILMMVVYGDDMSERLVQIIDSNQKTHDIYHGANRRRKAAIAYVEDNYIIKLLPGYKAPAIPENAISVEEAAVLVASDQRPVPARPSDVYVNVPVPETVATESAEGVVTQTVVKKERTYSLNALQFGLSFAIRLDTLWPRALAGFYKNPILGTGYATLTKEAVGQFTEAESTDNNFLRTLGETGLLGFITFYGVLLLSVAGAWHLYKSRPQNLVIIIFAIAFLGGTAGLLFNAIFIDVFAASKVAFTIWALAGIVLAIDANLEKPQVKANLAQAMARTSTPTKIAKNNQRQNTKQTKRLKHNAKRSKHKSSKKTTKST